MSKAHLMTMQEARLAMLVAKNKLETFMLGEAEASHLAHSHVSLMVAVECLETEIEAEETYLQEWGGNDPPDS